MCTETLQVPRSMTLFLLASEPIADTSWSHGQEGRSTLVQDLQIEIVTAMIMVIKKLPWMRIHSWGGRVVKSSCSPLLYPLAPFGLSHIRLVFLGGTLFFSHNNSARTMFIVTIQEMGGAGRGIGRGVVSLALEKSCWWPSDCPLFFFSFAAMMISYLLPMAWKLKGWLKQSTVRIELTT